MFVTQCHSCDKPIVITLKQEQDVIRNMKRFGKYWRRNGGNPEKQESATCPHCGVTGYKNRLNEMVPTEGGQ